MKNRSTNDEGICGEGNGMVPEKLEMLTSEENAAHIKSGYDNKKEPGSFVQAQLPGPF